MPGPDPKYTAEQRALQGNPGQRAADITVAAAESETPPGWLDYVPDPPQFMLDLSTSDTGALAINAWRQLAPLLIEARALRVGDQTALARYCRYVAEWITLTQVIDLEGFTITNTTKFGETTVRHPAVGTRGMVENSCASLEKELGLSPQARFKVQKQLKAALADLPLAGRRADANKGSPIGMLDHDDEDDE